MPPVIQTSNFDLKVKVKLVSMMRHTVSISVSPEVLTSLDSGIIIHKTHSDEINWVSFVPQIGGSAIGCKQATGVSPVATLSYSAFDKNDRHLRAYWDKVPHLNTDKDVKDFWRLCAGQEIDFVTTICPCAGLSRLNISKSRGSEAEQNYWMMETARVALRDIKPKVFWGENAPELFMKDGKDLVAKLREVGRLHGYSFSMVKTNTEMHGLPQKRLRTFYFFWKSPSVPLLNWKMTPHPSLTDYLAEIPKSATLQTTYKWPGKASELYVPYKFVLQKEALTHKEFTKKVGRTTIAKYIEDNGWIEECLEWLREHYPHKTFDGYGRKTFIYVFEHIKTKLANGKGYWDDSLRFMGDCFTAVIGKNIEFAVHPTEDRFFSIRELLHLMGMPHDFQMPAQTAKTKINSICQNVPVNTAKDWADEVVKFCRGEANMTSLSFLKQNNIDQSIVETSEHSPQLMEIRKKRKASSINKVVRKLKTELKEEMKLELNEELSELKREIVIDVIEQLTSSLVVTVDDHVWAELKKEEIEVIELDYEDDSLNGGLEYECGLCNFKAWSQYSLQVHWTHSCPGQAKLLLECGICCEKFRDIVDINRHWQRNNGCWSRASKDDKEDKRKSGRTIGN